MAKCSLCHSGKNVDITGDPLVSHPVEALSFGEGIDLPKFWPFVSPPLHKGQSSFSPPRGNRETKLFLAKNRSVLPACSKVCVLVEKLYCVRIGASLSNQTASGSFEGGTWWFQAQEMDSTLQGRDIFCSEHKP